MATDAPFTPPKKKPNVLWWVGGAIALVLFIFLLQLFGPNPPIIVSPQTTYITSPLGADGLPDYEQYLLERQREGVTPENNAAVLMWQAMWPGELDPSHYDAVVKELQLERVPAQEDSLVDVYDQSVEQDIREWLQTLEVVSASEDPSSQGVDPTGQEEFLVEEVIKRAISRPWTSEQVPPLAAWTAANKNPLDVLVEASKRRRYASPSPSLLDGKKTLILNQLIPDAGPIRNAARSLSLRAMWHLGNGQVEDAWRDLHACHRIARLMAQSQTLVEQMVAIAIHLIACEGTLALFDNGNLTLAQARQIQRDLSTLPNFSTMIDSIDKMDRLMFLDAIINQAQGDIHGLDRDGIGDSGLLGVVSIDWNVALIQGNHWFDRLVTTCRITDHAARSSAFDQIESELQDLELVKDRRRGPGIFSSRKDRSEVVASIYVSLMLPAAAAAMNAQDKANAMLDLTRLAAALAVNRAEHGAYPENLDALVPEELEKLPIDLVSTKPYVYHRDGEGYVLYCVGTNGIDNGGSSEKMSILNGQLLDEFDTDENERLHGQIPAGADDFSIRLPTPKWRMPNRPATSEP